MKKFFTVCFAVIMMLLLGNSITVMAESSDEGLDTESPVQVAELTDEDLSSIVYGARVFIPEGVNFYSSADEGGSGKYGAINNVYTPLGADLYIGGYARLNTDGYLVQYERFMPSEVPVASSLLGELSEVDLDEVWVLIFLNPDDVKPVGWLPIKSIAVINGILGDDESNARFQNGVEIVSKLEQNLVEDVQSEDLGAETIDKTLPDPGNMLEDRVIQGQDIGEEDSDFITTREIAYAIEDYTNEGLSVALLLDASGSVMDYMADIADYGNYVDKVNKADIIVAFGYDYKQITAEQYLNSGVDASHTDIYAPLNALDPISHYDRIILVTDTYHNVIHSDLNDLSTFDGKIVIVSPVDLGLIWDWTVKDVEDAFDTIVYLCRLDNELDRIRALDLLRDSTQE